MDNRGRVDGVASALLSRRQHRVRNISCQVMLDAVLRWRKESGGELRCQVLPAGGWVGDGSERGVATRRPRNFGLHRMLELLRTSPRSSREGVRVRRARPGGGRRRMVRRRRMVKLVIHRRSRGHAMRPRRPAEVRVARGALQHGRAVGRAGAADAVRVPRRDVPGCGRLRHNAGHTAICIRVLDARRVERTAARLVDLWLHLDSAHERWATSRCPFSAARRFGAVV